MTQVEEILVELLLRDDLDASDRQEVERMKAVNADYSLNDRQLMELERIYTRY